MGEQQNKDRAERLAALKKKLAESARVERDEDKRLQQLSRMVQDAGWQFFVGTVSCVGQSFSGSPDVSISSSAAGYSSQWPQWAFEQAKAALLYGKKIWVISDGEPFGYNLLAVSITFDNA